MNKELAHMLRTAPLSTPTALSADAVRDISAALTALLADVLLTNFPTLTVERHLRNFRWRNPADISHYRDGLLKAGVPFGKLTLVDSTSKRTA